MTVGSSTLRAAFARRFDGPPDVVWRAPGRVNLIGEHTDYNDGFVLPWALPLGVSAALRRNDSGVLRMVSLQHGDEVVEAGVADLEPGSVPGWAGYPAGVVWRLRRAGLPVGDAGFDLVVDGDVPAGAGLSSSAALECVVVRAIDDVLGLGLTGPDAAAHARGAENEFVGVPSGVMDQMASLMCAEGCALFLDTRSMATRQVPLDLDPGAGGGLALLLVDTNAPHRLVDGEYADRQRACAAGARALGVPALRDVPLAGLDDALARLDDEVVRRRVRHVVTENARVLDVVGLLDAGRPEEIGPLLTASHASLRDDFEVTVPELDTAVAAALDAGALGARMTGGGFGGSVVVLARTDAAGAVTDAIAAAFADRGYAPPRALPATPSAGAHPITDD
ncbi:galactokinase [Pseudonocardia dioxanivorans CB1190]|uniref:Galactokinase n=1 Tax=Pseudonocardia dioxanivorans (strain ATCC 55486 / DSM 44775 / JCM 13855 / CB1190) TaxID=675635 RepID=F4D0Y2_PSEUX|nr:galactokinase [Pseudonocardia dioxanivorans]AEA25834.1 galactokinase [Pseudonocardia dioxanivorans CB1190]